MYSSRGSCQSGTTPHGERREGGECDVTGERELPKRAVAKDLVRMHGGNGLAHACGRGGKGRTLAEDGNAKRQAEEVGTAAGEAREGVGEISHSAPFVRNEASSRDPIQDMRASFAAAIARCLPSGALMGCGHGPALADEVGGLRLKGSLRRLPDDGARLFANHNYSRKHSSWKQLRSRL